MIEKNCYSCKTVLDFMIPDKPCGNCFGWKKWQPSELYTAYLAAEARANKAEVSLLLAKDKVAGGCRGVSTLTEWELKPYKDGGELL